MRQSTSRPKSRASVVSDSQGMGLGDNSLNDENGKMGKLGGNLGNIALFLSGSQLA